MNNWQPFLIGSSLRLRPLKEADFDSLFSAASDPLIWELHPDKRRYTRERFEVYFRSGIESKGALAIIDLKSGKMIGSSRYCDYNSQHSSIEIGFTFLTRDYWGGAYNRELKWLMLGYAFQFIDKAYFVVGKDNFRSSAAMLKIGGVEVTDLSTTPVAGDLSTSIVYQIKKEDWLKQERTVPFLQMSLETSRLHLEPITEQHSEELWELFRDPELHHFVPFEPISLEKQRERCAKWAKRRSPDGTEIWLNWAARERTSGQIMAHFQAGVKENGTASIGYVVARAFQGKGLATEGVQAVFSYLRDVLGVCEVKAWSDTRNKASHRLAQRLGMIQVDHIKDADFFKGASSDEFVFSKIF